MDFPEPVAPSGYQGEPQPLKSARQSLRDHLLERRRCMEAGQVAPPQAQLRGSVHVSTQTDPVALAPDVAGREDAAQMEAIRALARLNKEVDEKAQVSLPVQEQVVSLEQELDRKEARAPQS